MKSAKHFFFLTGEKKEHLLIGLNLFPLFISLFYVVLFGVNVPVVHDWLFIDNVKNCDNLIKVFWDPCNGQRNFVPKVIYLIVYQWFDFNVKLLIFINFFVLVLSYFTIFLIFKKYISVRLLHFLPISWLFFSLVQYSNMLFAWQLSLNISIMGALLCFYFLQKQTPFAFLISILFAIISYASFGNGLLIFPIGLLYLILSGTGSRYIIAWSIISVFLIAFYFIDYSTLGVSYPKQPGQLIFFLFNLLSMASVLPIGKMGGMSYDLGIVIGSVLCLTIIILTFIFIVKKMSVMQNALLISVFLYFCAILLQISLGRSGSEDGIAGAYSTQYSTFVILFYIHLYIIFLKVYEHPASKLSNPILRIQGFMFKNLIFFIIFTLIIGNAFGLIMGPYTYGMHTIQKHILQTYQFQNQEAISIIRVLGVKSQNEYIDYLKENKKTLFSIYIANSMILQPKYDLPLRLNFNNDDKYFQGDSLTFNFSCKAKNIKNLSLAANASNSENNDSLILEISKNDVVLIRETLSSRNIYKKGRIYLSFNNPISDCMNKLMKIKFIKTGNSIRIPVFKSYYGGAICAEQKILSENCYMPAIEYNTDELFNFYYFTYNLRNRMKTLIKQFK